MAQQTDYCHFIPGILAIPPGDEVLRRVRGIVEIDPTQRLPEVLEGLDEEDIAAVAGLVALVDVSDPHEDAARLVRGGIPAAPIHAVGYQGHTKAMSGTAPAEVDVVFPEVPAGGEHNIVAVVDTGITDKLPEWMSNSVIYQQQDVEGLDTSQAVPASHGTFVCSIIRQITPSHSVSVGAARPDTGQLEPAPRDSRWDDDDRRPTNELEVAAAIERLIRRHSGDPCAVKALNLSLGAYQCESGAPDSFMLTTSLALDHWRRVFPDCAPIFSAGGNSTDERTVYPGAFDFVRAVGAGRGRSQVVWDSGNEIPPPKRRDWIGDVALGSKVIGLSGQDDRHAIEWSGSSFASAVATASYVKGGSRSVDHGIVWWPDSVGGLHHS